MTKDYLKSALIRAGRTFAQTFLGIYMTGLTNVDSVVGLGNVDLLNSAVAGAIVAVLALAQNLLEANVPYDRG